MVRLTGGDYLLIGTRILDLGDDHRASHVSEILRHVVDA